MQKLRSYNTLHPGAQKAHEGKRENNFNTLTEIEINPTFCRILSRNDFLEEQQSHFSVPEISR